MEEFYRTRIEQGLRVLGQVQAMNKPFSLGLWLGEISEVEWEEGPNLDSGDPKHECGSVGCGIGWMTQDPWHQQQGLRIGILHDDEGIEDVHPVPFYRDPHTGKITTGWSAVAEYFGITAKETIYLFEYEYDDVTDRVCYKTIDHVIERLEQFWQKCKAAYDQELADLDNSVPF